MNIFNIHKLPIEVCPVSSAPAVQLIHLLRRLKERVGSPIKREVWQKKEGDDDDDGDGEEEDE